MYNIIIKHFFIYLGCIYLYYHLTHINVTSILQRYMYAIAPVCLSLLTLFLRMYFPGAANILPLLLLWIILSCITLQPKITFVAAMLSFGISHGIFLLSGFTLIFLVTPIRQIFPYIPYHIFLIIVGGYEIFLLKILFKFSRFRSGMPFLTSTHFINIGLCLCLLFLSLLTYSQLLPHFNFPCRPHLLVAGTYYQVLPPEAAASGDGIYAKGIGGNHKRNGTSKETE